MSKNLIATTEKKCPHCEKTILIEISKVFDEPKNIRGFSIGFYLKKPKP